MDFVPGHARPRRRRRPCYDGDVPPSLHALLAAVLLGAAALVVHLAVWRRVARASSTTRAWRLLALLPPLTPIAAWRAGLRGAALAWVVAVALYLAVRCLAPA